MRQSAFLYLLRCIEKAHGDVPGMETAVDKRI